MSYDYFLFAKPADGSPPLPESMAENLWPIASTEQTRARIGALFPAVQWRRTQETADAWIGLQGPPEFLFKGEANGLVNVIKAAYIERHEVDRLAEAMQLAVFDPQTGEWFAL